MKALLPGSKVGTRPPEAPSPRLLPDRVPTFSETAVTLRKRGRTTASAAVGVDGASSPSSSSGSGSDWSSGDDTIDEFPSSEEPTSHMIGRSATTHAHGRTPLPKHLALPSMLTYATPSAPPADQQHSSSPSDSVTVGSLQQTPLDLSLNSSRSEQEDDDGTITGSNKEPPKEEGSTDARDGGGGDANHVTVLGLSQVNRGRPGGEGTCVPPEQQQVQSRSLEAAAEFSDDLSGEEWCLTLDASTEKEEEEEEEEKEEGEEVKKEEEEEEGEKGVEDTVKELSRMEDCKTPVAKRRRTDQGGYTPAAQDESRGSPKSALHYATHTPRRLFHCGVVTMVTEEGRQADTVGPHPSETVIEYIDLTVEDDVAATTTVKKERTWTDGTEPMAGKDHQTCLGYTVSQSSQIVGKLDSRYHKRSTPCRDGDGDTVSPEVIVLSDSPVTTNDSSQPCPGDNDTGSNESSVNSSVCPLDSPLFLPPTPGREGVESILNRRSIAF